MSLANTPVAFPIYDYRTLIRERHLDTFGHVNNAQYLVLFEEARWEMISSRGYGLKDVHHAQIGTVILECSVKFRRELKLREEIMIRTRVDEVSFRTLTVKHEILKEGGKLAAEASFVMGCFDLRSRKLIAPTQDWLAAVTGVTS
jgi:YbgC/YbaW family acyl-CoA thioester hydrolase